MNSRPPLPIACFRYSLAFVCLDNTLYQCTIQQEIRCSHMAAHSYDVHFLTTVEVSVLLRISRRTVCLWAECSELPAVRIGKQWRFRRDDINRWIDRAAAKSQARVEVVKPFNGVLRQSSP